MCVSCLVYVNLACMAQCYRPERRQSTAQALRKPRDRRQSAKLRRSDWHVKVIAANTQTTDGPTHIRRHTHGPTHTHTHTHAYTDTRTRMCARSFMRMRAQVPLNCDGVFGSSFPPHKRTAWQGRWTHTLTHTTITRDPLFAFPFDFRCLLCVMCTDRRKTHVSFSHTHARTPAHARTHRHTHTHPHTHTHAHTHTQTHTHAHSPTHTHAHTHTHRR